MITKIRTPYLGANDKNASLVQWHKQATDWVSAGDIVCTLETTKTTIDVEASISGYLYWIEKSGSQVVSDKLLAIVTSAPLDDPRKVISAALEEERTNKSAGQRGFTKKAELLIKRHNLDSEELKNHFDHKISEQDINQYLEQENAINFRRGFVSMQRIGVIGGVAGGGALIVVDALLRNTSMQPVYIFDRDKKFKGKEILGVPVEGEMALVAEYVADGRLDAVIIAFNRNLAERGEVFEELSKQNIPFCNVIDESVDIRSQVKIGIGNVILANTYIGPCTQIGNNNFITSGTHLEHGNVLGHHCAFGPAVATSGNVSIGDRVRFAAGITIEPDIIIGDDSVISSGAVIRENVSKNHVLRVEYSQIQKKINITKG